MFEILTMKSRRSSTAFNGRASAFGVSQLVVFALEDGESVIVTAPGCLVPDLKSMLCSRVCH